METLFSIVVYILFGFFGFILLLFVLAMLFGKRMETKWEFEAEFRDDNGKEFGEFEIKMSRIVKEEPDFSFKARFKLRHLSLVVGQRVQVYLDKLLVMEGEVETAGRILLRKDAVVNEVTKATAGQICRVVYGGLEQFREAIRPD